MHISFYISEIYDSANIAFRAGIRFPGNEKVIPVCLADKKNFLSA
jgi:hypothetical protein